YYAVRSLYMSYPSLLCLYVLCQSIALLSVVFFFFNASATTQLYTLSLHDALPICRPGAPSRCCRSATSTAPSSSRTPRAGSSARSEEHTSELQSRENLVCRLLLEKKKQNEYNHNYTA